MSSRVRPQARLARATSTVAALALAAALAPATGAQAQPTAAPAMPIVAGPATSGTLHTDSASGTVERTAAERAAERVVVRLVVLFDADFAGARDAIPPQVVVVDSAGALVAVYQHRGMETPLAVRAVGPAVRLRGSTFDGDVDVRLTGTDAADPTRTVRGRWRVGGREGIVRPVQTAQR